MKTKIIVAALVLATSFTAVQAQDQEKRQPPPIEQRVKMTVERMTTDLSLTEKQQKEVEPVFTDFYTAMQKLRESEDKSPEARKKLTDERNTKLAKILDAEQLKKYETMEAERREKMKERRKPGE